VEELLYVGLRSRGKKYVFIAFKKSSQIKIRVTGVIEKKD